MKISPVYFLSIFAAIYGSFHFYLYHKVMHVLRPGPIWHRLLILVLFLLFASMFAIHAWEHRGHIGPARWLGGIAYVWMAVVFWFLAVSGSMDLWNLGLRLVAFFRPAAAGWAMEPLRQFMVAWGVVIVFLLAGWWESTHLRVRTLEIASAKLPAGSAPLRIVQISDLHAGIHRSAAASVRLARTVQALQPDLLVSTGDLVDSQLKYVANTAVALREIRAPLGKLAVLGNHEFYSGLDNALAFHRAAGFTVLREQAAAVASNLVVAGVDDPAGVHQGLPDRTSEPRLFQALEKPELRFPTAGKDPYVLLLKHQPRVADSSSCRFDLQLSGHTHGGQLFPFGLLVRLAYPRLSGRCELPWGGLLYISRGAGCWGPPLRLGAPPEVTLIVLSPRS